MAWFSADVPPSGGGSQVGDLLALATAGTDANPVTFNMSDSVLHTSATSIPSNMFNGNDRIATLELANIQSVGNYAFKSAGRLKKIDLPSCVSAGESAFEQVGEDLASTFVSPINLPACKTLGASAFRNFRSASSANNTVSFVLTSLETTGVTCFRCNSNALYCNEIYLPAIKTLGNMTFANTNIVTLKLGPNCTSVGNNLISGANITNLIVEALSPPTCGGLGTAPTHIYVPDGSVALYKGTSGWSTYSNIIESIDNI